MKLSIAFIKKVEYLLAHNNYGNKLNCILEDLIVNKYIKERIELTRNASAKKQLLSFYLDFIVLCVNDKEFTEAEILEIRLLKQLFNINDEDIVESNPERVQYICSFAVSQSLLQNYNIENPNNHIQEALGISYDQFLDFTRAKESAELDLQNHLYKEFENKIIKEAEDEYDNEDVNLIEKPFSNKLVTSNPQSSQYNNFKFKYSKLSTNIWLQKVTPHKLLLGLSLLAGYYVYQLYENFYLSILSILTSLFLIHILLFSMLASCVLTLIGAYFIYDFIGYFSNSIILQLGISLLAFIIIFSKLFQYNKENIEYARDQDRSRHIPKAVKAEVYNRDGGMCVECGSSIDLEYDHNIPFSKGGSNSAKNIQLLCQDCNRRKSNQIDG